MSRSLWSCCNGPQIKGPTRAMFGQCSLISRACTGDWTAFVKVCSTLQRHRLLICSQTPVWLVKHVFGPPNAWPTVEVPQWFGPGSACLAGQTLVSLSPHHRLVCHCPVRREIGIEICMAENVQTFSHIQYINPEPYTIS